VQPKINIKNKTRRFKAKSDQSKNTFMMLDRSKRVFSAKGTTTDCPTTLIIDTLYPS